MKKASLFSIWIVIIIMVEIIL